MKLNASTFIQALIVVLLVAIWSTGILTILNYYTLPTQKTSLQLRQNRSLTELIEATPLLESTFSTTNKWQQVPGYTTWNNFYPQYKYYSFGYKKVLAYRLSNDRDTSTSIFQLGYTIPNQALYIQSSGHPMRYTGKAHAIGNVSIPSTGFKGAYIESKSPLYPNFIQQGKVSNSRAEFPSSVQRLLDDSFVLTSPNTSSLNLGNTPRHLHQSFSGKTLFVEITGNNWPALDTLSGNIILWASDSITVPSSIVLDKVIIQAPSITVTKRCTLEGVQLIAQKKLLLHEGTILNYPSMLVLQGKGSECIIEKSCFINGDIVAFAGENVSDKQKPYLLINNDVTISGTLVCDGFLDNRGTINGSTYCSHTIVETISGLYGNHIMDGTFDRGSISPFQLSSLPFNEKPSILSWLD